MDDIIDHIVKESIGCVFRSTIVSSSLYADDILLLAPSIDSLQRLVNMCEHELGSLDLAITVKKSACTRIGPRCNVPCHNISTMTGASLQWVDTVHYPGVYIIRSRIPSKVVSIMLSKVFIEHSTPFMVR